MKGDDNMGNQIEARPGQEEAAVRTAAAEHLKNPKLVTLESLLGAHQCEHCVDGRDPEEIVGNPAGDLGIIFSILAAVETNLNQNLNESQIFGFVKKFARTLGKINWHSDSHATDHLAEKLKTAPNALLAEINGTPSLQRQKELLNYLVMPDFIGCGHAKLMTQHSEQYGVRQELVAAVIRSFYKLHWNNSTRDLTDFEVLEGGHAEQGVLSISTPGLTETSVVPAVAPSQGNRQFFIAHQDVAAYMTGKAVTRLKAELRKLGVTNPEQLTTTAIRLAGEQTNRTLHYLAPGKPIISVVFDQNTRTFGKPTIAGIVQ